MLILATSPRAISRGDSPIRELVQALIAIAQDGNGVGVISNQEAPPWFGSAFSGSKVEFARVRGRQDGKALRAVAKKVHLEPHDTLVLATTPDDMQMGKNGGAVLVAGAWSSDQKVRSLGIQVAGGAELVEVVNLTAGWPGAWWFSGTASSYCAPAGAQGLEASLGRRRLGVPGAGREAWQRPPPVVSARALQTATASGGA